MPIRTETVHYRKATLTDDYGRKMIATKQPNGKLRITVPKPVEVSAEEIYQFATALTPS